MGTAAIIALGLVLALALYLGTSDSFAQTQTRQMEKVAPRVDVKKLPQICTKADLAQWKDNLPLGTKSEFPFSTQCQNCWQQLGVMNLPTMIVWITNKGATNAPASKAKMTWESGKAPFGEKSKVVNVPAIEAGKNYLLTIDMPQGDFFQTAKPVKLELDSAKQIDECNENNNILTYNY